MEFDLFTVLGEEKLSAAQLGEALGLHPRATYDFLDALVALRFLDREGDGAEGRYKNTRQTAAFLNKKSQVHRRCAADVELALIRILEASRHGTENWQAPKRNQGRRQVDIRGALLGPGRSGPIYGCHDRWTRCGVATDQSSPPQPAGLGAAMGYGATTSFRFPVRARRRA